VRRWVQHGRYDAVVSTYPLASQTLGGLKARGCIDGPLVTYLTDPAAHRTWVHEHVDVHRQRVDGEQQRCHESLPDGVGSGRVQEP